MKDVDSSLAGLFPRKLAVRSSRILLDSLIIEADIGFHDIEVGTPQRLSVIVEIWLDHVTRPTDDDPAQAWDYDHVRSEIRKVAMARRYNLQETLGHAIFERLGSLHGVSALRLRLSKPDVYPDAEGVGVEMASFKGRWPDR
jgi:dihydroneopterin aldolase